jgi:hypothetical protein
MRKGIRRTTTAVIICSQFEFGSQGVGRRTRLPLTRCLEDFFQSQNLLLGDQQSEVTVRSGIVTVVVRMMDQRRLFSVEFEAKLRDSCLGPARHGPLTDRANDVSSLPWVVVTLSIEDIRPELFHPETQRHSGTDFKNDFPRPDRDLGRHPDDQADGFYE